MKTQINRARAISNCLSGLLSFEDRFDQVTPQDADQLCERLAWHKVLPLAAALSDPAKPKCETLTAAFQKTLLGNMIREEHYRKQALRLFKIFKDEKIIFIPFKGPFWLIQSYDAYHWRHIGDIDLLLPFDHVRKASAILGELGYRPQILEERIELDFERRGELGFFPRPSDSKHVPVELHWEPMPSPRFLRREFLRRDDFFAHTTASQWRDLTYEQPSPEIQFIYLLLHATCQHQFMRFVHITTLAHFIQSQETLDWSRILDFAVERHACTPLYAGLEFVRAFWPLPGPAEEIKTRLKKKVPLRSRFMSSWLRPYGIVWATKKKGAMRRNLFRAAMSW